MQDTLHNIALTLVPGVGDILVRQLVSYCGSAVAVFQAPVARLLKIPGIGEVTARAIRRPEHLTEAEAVQKRLDKLNARALFYTDADYPARLKTLYDSPAMLYFLGNADLNAPRMVSLVGTRQATDYGRRIDRKSVV